MTSLADTPSEARCKQLIYALLTSQEGQKEKEKQKQKVHHQSIHAPCGKRIAWRRGRDYGWCRVCRMKVRPKAQT